MRIAVLSGGSPQRDAGGAEIVAFRNSKALAARGHEILMVTSSGDRSDAGRTVYEGIPVHTIAREKRPFRKYTSVENPGVVDQLERVLSDFKPDVVHAHNVHPHLSYSSLRVAKQLGARIVHTCHDVTTFHQGGLYNLLRTGDFSVSRDFNYRASPLRLRSNAIRNWRIRRVLNQDVDRIIAVSHALKDALEQNGISNVEVVHNAVDVANWAVSKSTVEAWKRAKGIGDAAILFGGRISEAKGSINVVDAFAIAARRIPGAQLLVIGRKNRAAETMHAHAKTLGVAHRVVFAGWLDDRELRAAYHASALVVTPSICFDSLTLMNLEAMACAKPVISTCLGGAREAITDGVTGYIINPYDTAKFADKIGELLTDQAKSERFGRAGYHKVSSDFSLSTYVERLECLLLGLQTGTRRVTWQARISGRSQQKSAPSTHI